MLIPNSHMAAVAKSSAPEPLPSIEYMSTAPRGMEPVAAVARTSCTLFPSGSRKLCSTLWSVAPSGCAVDQVRDGDRDRPHRFQDPAVSTVLMQNEHAQCVKQERRDRHQSQQDIGGGPRSEHNVVKHRPWALGESNCRRGEDTIDLADRLTIRLASISPPYAAKQAFERPAGWRAAPRSGHPKRSARFETGTVPLNADIVEASIAEIYQLFVRAGPARPIGEALFHAAPRQRAARMNGSGCLC